jgi:predicted nucleic acid-binding protein
LEEHLRSHTPWCITWSIAYEFLRVATHGRVFAKPLKPKQALAFIEPLLALDEVSCLIETDRHCQLLEAVITDLPHAAGNLFHDIHTATLMREYGIREIVTADTDFLQFPFLTVLNPLR